MNITYIHTNVKSCQVCGRTDVKLVSHHGVPKSLKPKSNFIVPVCKSCHRKIHAIIQDMNTISHIPFVLKVYIRDRRLRRENRDLIKHNRKLIEKVKILGQVVK